MRASPELLTPEPDCSEGQPTSEPFDDLGRNFAAVVRNELEWVWRLLRRVGLSPADADDATQQVFLVASRRQTEVQGRRTRAFLYGIAIRVAANARRSLRRRREVPSEAAGGVATGAPSLDELVEQHRARALLDQLLARLPVELCRVLVLAEIEQLTTAQIAELEAIPTGTVASRLRRARTAFYALLEQEQHRNPFDRRQA
jgi:RNA polymerase sigma-70 factor (ECF subfamily)